MPSVLVCLVIVDRVVVLVVLQMVDQTLRLLLEDGRQVVVDVGEELEVIGFEQFFGFLGKRGKKKKN